MWIRKIKKKKIAMFLIGLIVMISSTMMAASIGIIQGSVKPMDNLIKETKAPLLFMAIGRNDKDALDIKTAFEKDKRVTTVKIIDNVVMFSGKIKANNKEIQSSVNYFLSYKEGEFGIPKFLKGGGTLREGECFINSSTAESNKLSINDYITFESVNKKLSLKIKGIYTDPYSVSGMMGVFKYYVSEEQLKAMPGEQRSLITVYGDTKVSPKDIIKSFNKNTSRQIFSSIIDLDQAKMSGEIGEQIMGAFIAAFAIIILIVSAVVIRVSILDSIIKEYKTIGVYKAMGYGTVLIANIYLEAYGSIILISSLLGSFLSRYVTNYVLTSSFEVYGKSEEINNIPAIAITVIFVSALMLITIYRVVRRTKRISPIEAFRLGMPINDKKGISLGFIKDSFSPFSQAVRKIVNYPKVSVILFLILFICSYTVAFSVTNYEDVSILSERSSFWFGLDNAQYRITIVDDKREKEIYDWVKNNDKIKNYIKGNLMYSSAAVSKDEIDGDSNIFLQVYEKYDTDIKEELIEGKNPVREDEIAVNKKLLEKTNKTLGDYIDIYIKGQKKSFLVVGAYQSMLRMGMNARVLEDSLKTTDADYRSMSISFNMKDAKDYPDFKKLTIDKFGKSVDVYESKDFYKDGLEEVMEPQKAALTPLMLMVMIIGAINIFSILTIMNLNGRREFCVYKSIGYDTKALISTNAIYTMILTLASILFCIPVFEITFPNTMNMIFKMFGIYNYPANVKPGLLLISMLIAAVFYILSTVLSSLSIRKFKIQQLNEE